MGASASKASRAAAGSAARQYPTRTSAATPSPTSTPSRHTAAPPRPSPTSTSPPASTSRSEAINLDASDPHFAQSLRSLGPVQPNPTLSQTSTFPSQPSSSPLGPSFPSPRTNPAIAVLEARAEIQRAADAEFQEAGVRGHQGRQFLDAFTIRNILVQRDEYGRAPSQIEKSLGLRAGVVARLGPRDLVGVVSEQGRAQQGVEIV